MKVQLCNLGTVNKNAVDLETKNGSITIIFSYKTPVHFSFNDHQAHLTTIMTRQNDWGVTTGKLLNEYQPDHKARIDGLTFQEALQDCLERL